MKIKYYRIVSGVICLYLLLLPFLCISQTGKLTGKVLSVKSGEPLIGATITLQGKSRATKTDQNGVYSLNNLPAGSYTLVVSNVSYVTQTLADVKIISGEVTSLDIVMEVSGKLSTVVVKSQSSGKPRETISSLLIAQKNRASVSDGISAESIKKTPDRNVSDVLKRVTGASVQEDKFVIVRGLNDRYNASFLNGGALPSSEDNRKAFAFNIFPAAAIDNLIIQKTATPDMPGEFAGGLINIETKSTSTKDFQQFSFGLGYNTISTFKDRNYYRGGRWDFLGFDNGVRGIPEAFPTISAYQTLTDRQLVEASKKLPNYWKMYKGSTLPNISIQYSAGKNYQRNQHDFLSWLLSATYNRTYTNNEGETNGFDINFGNVGQFGLLEQNKRFPVQQQNFVNTLFGILANASLKLNNNNTFSLKNILSINGEDRVVYREGFDDVLGAPDVQSKATAFWFTSNRIISTQASGEHYHSKTKIKFNWLASYSNITREMPSLRTMKYRTNSNGNWEAVIGGFTNEGGGNVLFFNNSEAGFNLRSDFARSFKIGNLIQNQLKIGAYYQTRDKQFDARKLNYNRYTNNNASFDVSLLYLPQDKIFSPQYMGLQRNGKGGFFIDDATQPEDSYEGSSKLFAYYAMLDQRVGKFVRFIYGARMEDFQLNFFSARLGATEPIRVKSNKTDFLPSANLVFSIGNKQNLRLSYAKTLNRPEFIELAPFLFYDFSTRLLVSGRETNKRAEIDNYDARYEFYPGKAQLFSVSFFHKKFTDPIELRFLNGVSTQAEYVNLPDAQVTGGEIETRLLLGALFGVAEKNILNKLTVYGNYTRMESKLTLTRDTSQKRLQSNRPMQGQSPYVFNSGISYSDDDRSLSATFSLNRVGPRIFISGNGQDGDYDIIEAPRTVFDFQLAKTFSKKNLEVKLNVKDILAQRRYLFYDVDNNQKLQMGTDQVLTQNNFGRVISLALTYKF